MPDNTMTPKQQIAKAAGRLLAEARLHADDVEFLGAAEPILQHLIADILDGVSWYSGDYVSDCTCQGFFKRFATGIRLGQR